MTSALITRTELEKSSVAVTFKERRSGCVFAAIFCAFVAFVLAVLNNIVLSDAASRQIFDSCHYIQTSRELYLWVQDLVLGTNVSVGKETLGSMLLIDGPILPVCGAITSALCGTAPSVATANILMLFQAAMHAFSAALVVSLANSWLRETRLYLSILAGILWAAYPGALAGAGMFLTETSTTALVLLLVWLSIRRTTPTLTNTSLGAAVACIALLKPPLLPLVAALLSIRCATSKGARPIPSLSAFVIGLAIVIAPWTAFTKYATGKAQVLPQRVPSVNLAVGNDVEFDGWHALPLPPLTMLEILQSPQQIVSSLARTHGAELVPLTLRKFSRLWAQPWIPSQREILGLSYDLQCNIHQLLIALSLPAILFALQMTRLTRNISCRRMLSSALCLVLFMHLLYLPFETVARYALPALPALLIVLVCGTAEMFRRKSRIAATAFGISSALAMFFIWQVDCFSLLSGSISNAAITSLIAPSTSLALFATILVSSWKHSTHIISTTQKIRGAAALAAVGCLAGGIAFATVASDIALPDWKTKLRSLSASQTAAAIRTIESAPEIDWTKVAGAYVLVDADKNIETAEITVNGVLAGQPGRAHEVCDYLYKSTVDEFLAICAKCRNLQPEDMRNWWLAPLDVQKISNQKSSIELRVAAKPNAPVIVYGNYVREGQKELLIPHLHYLGFSKLETSRDRIEYRHTDKFHRRTTKSTSQLQDGTGTIQDLSTEPGTQTGEYRIYLLIAYKVPPEIKASHDSDAWLYPEHQLWSIW